MTGKLFHEARRGNRGAVGHLLNRHVHDLRALATKELSQCPETRLDADDLVERTLRVAQHEFDHFTGFCDEEWFEWLGAILKRSVGQYNTSQAECLQVAMATLPTVQGQIVRLRQVNGWDLARIAAHLGLDEIIVAGLLRQGVRRLRDVVE